MEEINFKFESERKQHQREIILKKLKESQTKYDEAEYNYQCTGSASTMRTMHWHEDMIMIYTLALQALDNVCRTCESRRRRANSYVNKYENAKKIGNNDVLNFDSVIKEFIDLEY